MKRYASECLKRFNKKKIEVDSDIEEKINNQEFMQVNTFCNIDSRESIFILIDIDYYSGDSEEE